MRILTICDNKDKIFLESVLVRNNVAEQVNIIHRPNFEKAYEFLDNQLFENQGHIDLIITADKIANNHNDNHLVDRIRRMDEEYSARNFKIKKIPVILHEKDIFTSDNYQYGFSARVAKNDSDNQNKLVDAIYSVVKTARCRILDDLDLLGLDFIRLQSDIHIGLEEYYLMKIKSDPYHWAGRTQILSASFIRNPHMLDYDWLKNNSTVWAQDIESYEKIIRELLHYDRHQSEKNILHKFYNRAKWVLKLDKYNKLHYEPPFMKNDREYEEPDFVLSSAMPGIIPTNITEVKPHILPILQRRKRKPGFKQDFSAAMIQVSDYERHFRKAQGRQQLEELVRYPVRNISYNLLASNDEELKWNEHRVYELNRDHYPKIKIQTHDEKLRDAIRYFDRSQPLNMFKVMLH